MMQNRQLSYYLIIFQEDNISYGEEKKYRHLYEMENTWYKDKDAVKTFLLNGSVKFILKKEGSSDEALDYVQELMDMGRLNPEKACNLYSLHSGGRRKIRLG